MAQEPSSKSRPVREGAATVHPGLPPLSLLASRQESRLRPTLVAAWAVSAVVHVFLLASFLLIAIKATDGRAPLGSRSINTRLESEKEEHDLENDLSPEGKEPLVSPISERTVANPRTNKAESSPTNPAGSPPLPADSRTAEFSPARGNSPLSSPVNLEGIFLPGGPAGRSGSLKADLLRQGGGNTESERAVALGQKWLILHQAADGHWSLDGFDHAGQCNCGGFGIHNDIAATAFGLLPLLGAGETHKDPRALYRENVARGLRYLVLKQKDDGDFAAGMYAQGLATIAICEAYSLTGDPELRYPAQRAIDFIRAAQSDSGGWRYQPREGGDTSVLGWQLMALKSAQMAGLVVQDERNPTLANAGRWLDSCMKPDGGSYSYQPAGEATPTMTAVGLLCRLYLGTSTQDPGVRAGIARLKRTPPPRGVQSMYYYYYATQVLHHVGGPDWKFWNDRIRPMLVASQDRGNTAKHPHLRGSWSPETDVHSGSGGRLMMTSLAVLTLEVYYRHLPLYRRDLGATKAAGN